MATQTPQRTSLRPSAYDIVAPGGVGISVDRDSDGGWSACVVDVPDEDDEVCRFSTEAEARRWASDRAFDLACRLAWPAEYADMATELGRRA